MHCFVLWPTFSLVAVATGFDIYCRRIPNWLTLPFAIAGMVCAVMSHGMPGLRESLGGITLAVAALGVFCWLNGMGMGDLKLCAAVGAWIGFAQLGVALVITGFSGGLMALFWAARHGALKESIQGSGKLLAGFRQRGLRPHPVLTLGNPQALTMPYAPAIAIGTLLSFFC